MKNEEKKTTNVKHENEMLLQLIYEITKKYCTKQQKYSIIKKLEEIDNILKGVPK